MIRTKSGLLGFHAPLKEVNAESKDAALWQDYLGYRRVCGDGNCYYRSTGFALLERCLVLNPGASGAAEKIDALLKQLSGLEKHPIAQPSDGSTWQHKPEVIVQSCGVVREFIAEMRGLRDEENFYTAFLCDSALDGALVWVLRGLCAVYCLDNRDLPLGSSGMTLQDLVAATNPAYEGNLERFVAYEWLQKGHEGPPDALDSVLPTVLGCRLRVVQLERIAASDHTGGCASIDFPSPDAEQNADAPCKTAPGNTTGAADVILEDAPTPSTFAGSAGKAVSQFPAVTPDVTLLYKPGHYDLLYARSDGERAADLQTQLGLAKKCRKPFRFNCRCLFLDEYVHISFK
eukprot:TRINITY_DN8101_c0_g1_i1.p1 TRINITY_DN8101_c0_g1~~TRINITY_DN8101_c0_g1_i1.p1  ORF type:complete len:346 (+),score=48.87 TRINITY_DN8101_c0_g1_i1:80-1117(+)